MKSKRNIALECSKSCVDVLQKAKICFNFAYNGKQDIGIKLRIINYLIQHKHLRRDRPKTLGTSDMELFFINK